MTGGKKSYFVCIRLDKTVSILYRLVEFQNLTIRSSLDTIYVISGLGRLIEDDVADEKSSPGSAAETRDAAIEYMKAKRPKLLFVHLDSCDAAGHSETWGSNRYVNSLEEADGMIADFVNALKDEGMWDYTALLISSDHGGYEYSHGPDTYLDRTIPFIVRTPQGTEREIKKEGAQNQHDKETNKQRKHMD